MSNNNKGSMTITMKKIPIWQSMAITIACPEEAYFSSVNINNNNNNNMYMYSNMNNTNNNNNVNCNSFTSSQSQWLCSRELYPIYIDQYY